MKKNKYSIIVSNIKDILKAKKHKLIYYNIQILYYILLFYIICLSNEDNSNIISTIILTINGAGDQKIYNNKYFNHTPDYIYVNNENASYILKNNYDIYVNNLTEETNNITIVWNTLPTTCEQMFSGLSNIIHMDLSNFNTLLVTNMSQMFSECSSLKYLNIDFFNTSKVTDMNSMFNGCSSLKYLNLDFFNTSKVTDMNSMFNGCSSLKYLNLDFFNTSLVTNMNSMFSRCSSLTSLNLNNFDISSVINMASMFSGCSSLKYLYFNNNITTSKTTQINYMFSGCSSLISLDLSNFNTSLVSSMNNMFNGCSSLISLDLSNFNTSSVSSMNNMFNGCSSLISLDLSNFNTSSVSNMNSMFSGCSSLISLNLNKFIISDSSNMFFNCSSKLIICINETEANGISSLLSNYTNDCNNSCFINLEHKIIIEKNECIDYCFNDIKYKYEYNNICYETCPSGTFETDEYLCQPCDSFDLFNGKCAVNDFKKYISKEIMNGNLEELINTLLNDGKEELIIEENNIKYEITTTNNNNEYKNISIIKLGDCEKKLKDYYNISENEPLIIFKADKYEEGLLIPTLEYQIFDIKNNRQLDLNVCKDTKISILLPCNIDENSLFKYNLSSDYYNDICYSYTTNQDTDIILSDRKKEFVNNNMSLCSNDCEYSGYDPNTKKAKCECEINQKTTSTLDNKIDKDKLLNSFININEMLNLKIVKCYKQLFTIEGLKNNIGSFVILSIIFISIICIIIFASKGFESLLVIIYKIISKSNELKKESNINNNINKNKYSKYLRKNIKKKNKNNPIKKNVNKKDNKKIDDFVKKSNNFNVNNNISSIIGMMR